MKEDIVDFVIIWVDGNDEEWQKEKAKYSPDKNTDYRNIRYRDWDNLQYWFRGVEKFAPWVNKIHFVTCGHLPKWLNVNHPKLNIVKHSDFIPEKYLPTFSSHTIELNLHRIDGLADKFVFFNDDMFIVNYIKKEHFFENGKPCDIAVFVPEMVEDETFSSILNNNMFLLNKNFKKNDVLKKNFFKFFTLRNGTDNLKTLLCIPWHKMLGFKETHHANAFLKETYEKVWNKEFKKLDETCKNRFRSPLDVNQYIFKYWQFCEGNFYPQKNIKKFYRIFDDLDGACNAIKTQKFKLICLNDSDKNGDFEDAKKAIIDSFEKILPDKSSFEI